MTSYFHSKLYLDTDLTYRLRDSTTTRSFISPWHDRHHSHEYTPFRFPDPHHHYDPTSSYYPDAATAAAIDSYTSSATSYSPYMVHHHSPSAANTTAISTTANSSSSVKPETSTAAALQSAFSLSTPMNVNVSMNFNSHSVQYAPGYGSNTNPTASFGATTYDPFYASSTASHYPFTNHSPELKSSRSSDPVTTKQAMFLSAAAANYDYKDLSKLCDFFPGTTPINPNEKRTHWSAQKSSSLHPKNNEGRINRCRICGKIYARPSTLKTHLRTHSGEKPYKCDKCSKAFTQAANLTAHLRTHSGEKPFSCDVCGRKFSQSSSVTTHMRTHSGERPYQCKYCRKAFSDSSTLTKHMRVHSGEKPYECSLCRLRFSHQEILIVI